MEKSHIPAVPELGELDGVKLGQGKGAICTTADLDATSILESIIDVPISHNTVEVRTIDEPAAQEAFHNLVLAKRGLSGAQTTSGHSS